MRQVQEDLGHTSMMTMRYARVAPNHGAGMRRALDRSHAGQGSCRAAAPTA
jgi:hypothetical protein